MSKVAPGAAWTQGVATISEASYPVPEGFNWPGGAKLAVWISPNVEWYEFTPPDRSMIRNPYPRMPHPDVYQYSLRDYGNRIGFWRIAALADDFELPFTVSLSCALLEHCPEIRDAMVSRNWELMSHGLYNTRYLYDLSEVEEIELLEHTIDLVKRHSGQTLRGMLGPAISSSERTPALMARLGFVYQTDWWHDDRPDVIQTDNGPLISVPYTIELNDSRLFNRGRSLSADYYEKIIRAQFDELYFNSPSPANVMCIALHPFLSGQPHRIRAIRDAFSYLRSFDDVWFATASEIAEHFKSNAVR